MAYYTAPEAIGVALTGGFEEVGPIAVEGETVKPGTPVKVSNPDPPTCT